MSETTKVPGQAAFEAHREHFNIGLEKPLGDWESLRPEGKEHWAIIEKASRLPLAIQVYNARRSLARLLVTYRDRLLGDWYERSVEDAGMELDEIGFIKGPYMHEDVKSYQGRQEVEKIIHSA